MNAAPDALAARYGRTRQHRRRDRRLLIGAAIAFAVVLVSWVVWAGLDGQRPSLEVAGTGHTLHNDERMVEVTWRLSVAPGSETACVVQAYNDEFTVVGWKVVEIPASDTYTRSFTETVRVAQEANTGLVEHCWLT
ncbi:DUF4307 domain-containing protein [Agromyces agglutinans]|uniref:DUF4307 domain-containing protein n=1 Tax=Agromyces agglutinans TaxID=2662258 RepID=UPI00156299BC|nr:DUF4307 domain-containing protein [Agromyces agglutinans]